MILNRIFYILLLSVVYKIYYTPPLKHPTHTPLPPIHAGANTLPPAPSEPQRPRDNGFGPGLGMRLKGQRSGLSRSSSGGHRRDPSNDVSLDQIARLERFATLLSSADIGKLLRNI